MKTLTFRVKKTGEIQVDASGYAGGACLEDSQKFFDALGGDVKKQELTGEYYLGEGAGVSIHNG